MHDYNLLPCGVIITDFKGRVKYCNQAFSSMLECSIEDIVGHLIDDFLSNASTIVFQQIILPSVLSQKAINEVQINFITLTGNKLPMVIFAKDNASVDEQIIFCSFSAQEREKMIGSVTSAKKQLEKANAQLKILSVTDELTGCLNRRELKSKLALVRRQMSRRESSFALLVLDLDNFKKLNDNYGHTEGDYVLKQFATMLMESARFDDIVVRYGGEEFVIVMPNIDEKNALAAANRIHENMKSIRTKAKTITVSIGACVVEGRTDYSDKEIINLADKALYESKRTGKNKTTFLQFE